MNAPADETLKEIQAALQANPHTMTAQLARQHKVPETVVVGCLPDAMRTSVPADDFKAVWTELTAWEKITFIVMNPGIVSETVGQLPPGEIGGPMFNYHDKGNPIGGHFRITELGSIWLVAKPMKTSETLSVRFFDKEGHRICAVYAGRGEDRQLLPSVKEKFAALRARYAGNGAAD